MLRPRTRPVKGQANQAVPSKGLWPRGTAAEPRQTEAPQPCSEATPGWPSPSDQVGRAIEGMAKANDGDDQDYEKAHLNEGLCQVGLGKPGVVEVRKYPYQNGRHQREKVSCRQLIDAWSPEG